MLIRFFGLLVVCGFYYKVFMAAKNGDFLEFFAVGCFPLLTINTAFRSEPLKATEIIYREVSLTRQTMTGKEQCDGIVA